MRVGSRGEVSREEWDEAREGRRKRATRAKVGTEQDGEEVRLELGRGGGLEVLGDWSFGVRR